MRYLASFDNFNESVRDQMKPKSEEEVTLAKEELINYISDIVANHNGKISMFGDLDAEVEDYPVIEFNKHEQHVAEILYINNAEVGVYTSNFSFLKRYTIEYNDMDPESLLQIKETLRDAIENEVITESVRDQMKPKSEEEIDDAFEKVAEEVADIMVDKYDGDDFVNAYEWAQDHKEVIMKEIENDPDYDLDDIVYKILYGYEGATDSH